MEKNTVENNKLFKPIFVQDEMSSYFVLRNECNSEQSSSRC